MNSQSISTETVDLQVVGGGLAGLLAANLGLDAGLSVRLLEKQRSVGGRAGSVDHHGFTLNQGPHALYLAGQLNQTLGSLGLEPAGSPPALKGATGSIGSERDLLPQGPGSLWRTSLLSGRAKRQLVRFMIGLPRVDPEPLATATVDRWLDGLSDQPDFRTLLWGLVNLATYNSASDIASADAALAQMQLAMGDGVIYLDGGWSSIVDGLDRRLQQHVAVGTGRLERVTAQVLEITAGRPAKDADPTTAAGSRAQYPHTQYLCQTADAAFAASNVVIAAGLPAVADRLLGPLGHRQLAAQAGPPVQVAVLDLGLRSRPSVDIHLGLDRGLYLSNHSTATGMAPDGQALVSLARYVRPGEELDPDETRAMLLDHAAAAGIDRGDIVMERYMHRLTVTGGMPTATGGGLAGRPKVAVPGRPGLYLAGDWVGDRGLLSDASAASACDAVAAVVAARTSRSSSLPAPPPSTRSSVFHRRRQDAKLGST